MAESISETEKEQLKQLSLKLKDLHFDNDRFGKDGHDLFLRFLRENKHNLKHTEEALRKFMKFRVDHDMDTVANWEPTLKGLMHFEFCGYDDSGCPVYFLPWGSWEIKILCKENLGYDSVRRINQIFELAELKMKEQSKLLDKPVTGLMLIIDMSEFSIRRVLGKREIQYVLEAAKIVDAFHARTIKFCPIVNVPRTFSILWKIVTPLLRAELRNKVEFHPTCTPELQETLKKYNMHANVTPTIYGGTYQLQNYSIKATAENDLQDFTELEDEQAKELAAEVENLKLAEGEVKKQKTKS